MKKIIMILFMAAMLCMPAMQVCAADMAYRQKKQIMVDYTPIESYVIDGETYIPAEELAFYGFDVNYDADNHAVNISRKKFAYPVYTRRLWENASRKKEPIKIYKSGVTVYLDGQAVESYSIGGWELIRFAELEKYGTLDNYENGIEIFKKEISDVVDNAENKQEIEYTDEKYKKNYYIGQLNDEKKPVGWGLYEYSTDRDKIIYIGHFSNGKPDGLAYKETFKTVPKSYTVRRIKFIGSVDGSRKAQRDYISDGSTVSLIRGKNFNGFTLPFEEIPEWTGPEILSDSTVYLKGCYYEASDGKIGTKIYRIWYDGGDITPMLYTRCGGSAYSDIFDRKQRENEKIRRFDSFYEYNGENEVFYSTAIQTVSGDGTEENPIILNNPNDGAGIYPMYLTVMLNGELLSLQYKEQPVLENGRVLVPLRIISKKLGAEVSWNDETKTVTAVKDGKTVSITIGENVMRKDDEEIALDVPAKIIEDITFVPVRAVCDGLGASADWNDDIKRVIITAN